MAACGPVLRPGAGATGVSAGPVETSPSSGFGWFLCGQTLSGFGDRFTAFTAQSVAILVLGASSTQLGVLSATGWLAYPVLGMVAGAVLARVRLKRAMIAGELVRFAAFAGVAVTVTAGQVSVTQLLIVVAVAGAATVFVDISGQSLVPSLVGRGRLLSANSRLSGADSMTKLAGPALAGVLFGLAGPGWAAALAAVPFLLSAAARLPIRVAEERPGHRRDPPGALLGGMRQGVVFVWRHPLLRPLVCRSALRGFGTGAVDAVLLLFAYRGLGLSSTQGGLLMAAGSVGALAGAVLATRIIGRLGMRRSLLLTGLEGALWLAVPLCAVAEPLVVLLLIRLLSAVWLPVWGVLDAGLRQTLAPPGRQSTVHAVTRTLSFSAIPLGAVAAGFTGDALAARLGTPAGLGMVLAAGGLVAASGVLMLRKEALLDDRQVTALSVRR